MDSLTGNVSLTPLHNWTASSNATILHNATAEGSREPLTTEGTLGFNGSAGNEFNTELSPAYIEVLTVVYSVLWFFCVIGNSLVLTVMTRSPALRTRNNLFLCHLAVADLSVGLVCIIPNLIVARVMVWMPRAMGVFMCKFYNFFEEFSMTVSVLLLVLIAAERYVAIIHPLKARRLFTRFRMHAALALVWLAACLYNVPLLFIYVTFDVPGATYCYRNDGDDQVIHIKSYVLCSFLLTYVLPLILMATFYVKICITLWRPSPATSLPWTQASSSVRSDHKTTKPDRPDVKTAALDRDNQGPVTSPTPQPVVGELGRTQGVRSREGSDNRSRSSCTSRTSCSTTVSTSNTAVIDNDLANDPCHHRHDNGTCRPLLRACRSDPSRHDDHLGHDLSVHKFQRRNTVTTDHLPMTFTTPSSSTSSTSSRRQRFSTGSEMSSDTCRSVFYTPTLPSADSTAPLLASNSPEPPRLAGGQASAPVANSPASAVSPLTTSGSRDGVYILRPGTNTKTASCRYRVTSHHVLMTRRKVVRLLIVVLSSFALCVLPFHIRSLLWYWMPGQSQWKYGLPKYITQVLFFLNSALNPVLYSLMSDSFRRSARQVLCCNCRTRRPNKNLAAFGAREARNHHLALSRQAAQQNGTNRQ